MYAAIVQCLSHPVEVDLGVSRRVRGKPYSRANSFIRTSGCLEHARYLLSLDRNARGYLAGCRHRFATNICGRHSVRATGMIIFLAFQRHLGTLVLQGLTLPPLFGRWALAGGAPHI